MDWVWTKSKSKGVGRLVMLALADKVIPAEGECKAYGSYRFLAQRANCTQGAITEALEGLYVSGELELLPERGPMGAATYRLPLAVGHVREARTNRSAQRSDSSPKQRNESLGSAEQKVLGSAERLEAGSHGSAEHRTNPPPKTTTSAPSDPPATSPTEGGGGSELERAEQFLQDLPDAWACGRRTAKRLAPQLLERIHEKGWSLDFELERELTKNPGGIARFEAVLPRRIDDLRKRPSNRSARDSPAQSLRSLPTWCESEDCNPHTRMRTEPGGPNGYPVSEPCKACHPDMIKDTAA